MPTCRVRLARRIKSTKSVRHFYCDSGISREKPFLFSIRTLWKKWSDQTDHAILAGKRGERLRRGSDGEVERMFRFYLLRFVPYFFSTKAASHPLLPAGLCHGAFTNGHQFGGVCRFLLCRGERRGELVLEARVQVLCTILPDHHHVRRLAAGAEAARRLD